MSIELKLIITLLIESNSSFNRNVYNFGQFHLTWISQRSFESCGVIVINQLCAIVFDQTICLIMT